MLLIELNKSYEMKIVVWKRHIIIVVNSIYSFSVLPIILIVFLSAIRKKKPIDFFYRRNT